MINADDKQNIFVARHSFILPDQTIIPLGTAFRFKASWDGPQDGEPRSYYKLIEAQGEGDTIASVVCGYSSGVKLKSSARSSGRPNIVEFTCQGPEWNDGRDRRETFKIELDQLKVSADSDYKVIQ